MANDRVSTPITEMNESEALETFSRSTIAMTLSNPHLDDNPLVYVNRAFERLTGYSAEAAVGRNCRFLQGPQTREQDVQRMREAIAAGEDIMVVIDNHKADGTHFRNAVLITPITDDDGEIAYFLGIQREAGERDDDARRLEGLLSEVQHRVKNHLSMIVAMIRMQARRESAKGDHEALARRIESLQLLYEEMSAARAGSNKDEISLGAYVSRVANAVAHIDGRQGLRVNIDTEPLEIATEKAVHIGLIVSELLTNALKHAFTGRASGLLELRAMRTEEDGIRIVVADDGNGMPEDVDWRENGGLGSRILSNLVSGIDAELRINRGDAGTTAVLDVPLRPKAAGTAKD